MLGSKLGFPDDVLCGANSNVGQAFVLGYGLDRVMIASTWGADCDINADVPALGNKASAW